MNTATYNGWANRETWIVNLHWGDDTDYINEMAQQVNGDVDDMAEAIKTMVLDYIDEQTTNPFIRDLMSENKINWHELAEAWLSDYEYKQEEDEEEDEE